MLHLTPRTAAHQSELGVNCLPTTLHAPQNIHTYSRNLRSPQPPPPHILMMRIIIIMCTTLLLVRGRLGRRHAMMSHTRSIRTPFAPFDESTRAYIGGSYLSLPWGMRTTCRGISVCGTMRWWRLTIARYVIKGLSTVHRTCQSPSSR